jgi:hypothetical protein
MNPSYAASAVAGRRQAGRACWTAQTLLTSSSCVTWPSLVFVRQLRIYVDLVGVWLIIDFEKLDIEQNTIQISLSVYDEIVRLWRNCHFVS